LFGTNSRFRLGLVSLGRKKVLAVCLDTF
jgi:hypothetical protein